MYEWELDELETDYLADDADYVRSMVDLMMNIQTVWYYNHNQSEWSYHYG